MLNKIKYLKMEVGEEETNGLQNPYSERHFLCEVLTDIIWWNVSSDFLVYFQIYYKTSYLILGKYERKMDWIWMLRWAAKANKRPSGWSLKNKRNINVFFSPQYSSMQLGETDAEGNISIQSESCKKYFTIILSGCWRALWTEESNHSSTVQSQNCTGRNGIIVYTNMGFITLYYENNKGGFALLLRRKNGRVRFYPETIPPSVTQRRICSPFPFS